MLYLLTTALVVLQQRGELQKAGEFWRKSILHLYCLPQLRTGDGLWTLHAAAPSLLNFSSMDTIPSREIKVMTVKSVGCPSMCLKGMRLLIQGC